VNQALLVMDMRVHCPRAREAGKPSRSGAFL
jgi:hypothetical protein